MSQASPASAANPGQDEWIKQCNNPTAAGREASQHCYAHACANPVQKILVLGTPSNLDITIVGVGLVYMSTLVTGKYFVLLTLPGGATSRISRVFCALPVCYQSFVITKCHQYLAGLLSCQCFPTIE
jgi:hypothetical protein